MATSDTKTEVDSAPLLDLNEGSIKKLIARAKKRGYITYDELNEALPQDQMSSEQIEDMMSALSEMGINLIENDEPAEEGAEAAADDDDEPVEAEEGEPLTATAMPAVKAAPLDRTDDPVRMYLREMGAVELLSREGEIAIAKRIEAGRNTMIAGLCESPMTFTAMIDWSDALNDGRMQLREILDLDAMLAKPTIGEPGEDGEEPASDLPAVTFKDEADTDEAPVASADDDEEAAAPRTGPMASSASDATTGSTLARASPSATSLATSAMRPAAAARTSPPTRPRRASPMLR